VINIPLGLHENESLEFKQKESLRHPETIGRAVVAMLNSGARDGYIWIGIKEEDGTAVSIESIDDIDKERCSLRDYLMDVLEPAPQGNEIDISIEKDQSGQAVLQLRVQPSNERKPYALLKSGGRYFHIRVGDRIRPMSRDEIFSINDRVSGNNNDLPAVINTLKSEKKNYQSTGRGIYWITLKPFPAISINIQDRGIRDYLQDATLTENRPHGWNFMNRYEEPTVRGGRLFQGGDTGRSIEVREDGTLNLTIDIECLSHSKEYEIYPYGLIEYPVALFRLAKHLYSDPGMVVPDIIIADTALIGVKGWILKPYSPRSIHYVHPIETPRPWTESRDLIWERPLEFKGNEVVNEPDWCGFRLIRRIYEAFGYFEDKIPLEFDRSKRRLIIPE
jgi:hypothetical protein